MNKAFLLIDNINNLTDLDIDISIERKNKAAL